MGIGSNSESICVRDFFSNKLNNSSAIRCYANIKNSEFAGCNVGLSKYLNENSIAEMIKVNQEITNVMKSFNVDIKINMGILNNLVNNHLTETTNIALGMIKYLPKSVQKDVNRTALRNATGLHDIAKVIMPESIINKPGKLNEEELKIMREHARLSYEMLKTTDLDAESLDLIKAHHESHQHHKASIPFFVRKADVTNINLQILSIADIYSALREKRSYKDEISQEKALSIIKEETDRGKFHTCVYQALVKYAQNEEVCAENATKSRMNVFKQILDRAKAKAQKQVAV